MGRVGEQDVAGDQPIEEHAQGSQVLFDGRRGVGAPQLLDVGGHVHGRDRGQVGDAPLRAPAREALDGF